MTINRLTLENYRNYAALDHNFKPGTNVICGDNAQGKTNMLEAVYYLTAAKSFRGVKDRDLIKKGQEKAVILANISLSDRDIDIKIEIANRRTIFVNGVGLARLCDLPQYFKAVLFCPEDLYLIKDTAAQRRRFLDNAICQLKPRYGAILREYNKLLDRKNRVLKDFDRASAMFEVLEVYNQGMARLGAQLIRYRAWFVSLLDERAGQVYSQIAGQGEKAGFKYNTVKTVDNPQAGGELIEKQILQCLVQNKDTEIAARSCLYGIHKDDLEIFLDLHPARDFASQGQTRSLVIAMKLAVRQIIYQLFDEYPVLLLDDVLSELDQSRQEYILKSITQGQVIITCCQPPPGMEIITVKNGSIEG